MCQTSPVNKDVGLEKLLGYFEDYFWLEFLVASIVILDNEGDRRTEELKHQASMSPVWTIMGKFIE